MKDVRRDQLILIGWLAAIVAATFVHDPGWLALLLLAVATMHGRHAFRALKQALVAVALVNVAISAGYAVFAIIEGRPWLDFVVRLNLRVVLLVMVTLWMVRHARLERALAFSPSLHFMATLVQGQLGGLQTLLRDARQAFSSRNPVPASTRLRLRGAGRQAGALMEKAERHADALNQGMRARGFFDDRA